MSNKELYGLSSKAYATDGSLKSFKQQLSEFAFGIMPEGDMFIISNSSSEAGIKECPDLPIILKQSTLKKIEFIHELTLNELSNLPTWLQTYPPSMESFQFQDALIIIADAKDKDGRDLLIALHLEKSFRALQVNEIASIYGKAQLSRFINNTVKAGLEVYVNSRTNSWLLKSGLSLENPVNEYLQKKLTDFYKEHPKIKKTETPSWLAGVQSPERTTEAPSTNNIHISDRTVNSENLFLSSATVPSVKKVNVMRGKSR